MTYVSLTESVDQEELCEDLINVAARLESMSLRIIMVLPVSAKGVLQ
jgi:hypothetical protein